MALLPDDEVRSALARLPGWSLADDGQITREYRLAGFPDAIAFVVRMSYAAEAADHHPDIDVRYNKVRVTLSTHSEGGVTTKDLDLARAIDAVLPYQP